MWLSQYMQNYISDYFYYNIGGTTDIYSLFDYAMTGFDADTQNHTVLREIVILTDGGGLDPSEYSAALAEAKANDVVVSVLAYGASANQSVNGMMPITWATGGTYGKASSLSTFIQSFRNVLDLGADTDNDGIPDDLEDDLILYNGKTISTDYELADTDGDGLKDGEEVRIEVKYSPDGNYATVVGHLISDPTSEDGDGDGYLDNCDEHPLDWDVGDRDLAMFAALAYEDGSNYIGSFYSTIVGNPAVSEPDQRYYWLNYAKIDELSLNNWQIIDYQNTLSNTILNDYFSATTYKNGNNIIISYRGTDDAPGEWADDFICYGFGNYHSEEALAEQYAMRIYNNYIAGNENAKLYITGHSLGGYLAQIGAAKLINTGNWLRLKKVVYFNGMGLKFNDFGFWQKNAEIEALELFGKNQGEPNGKLICYHIVGDIVSLLGTHCGEEKWFDATDLAKINHLIDSGRVIQDLIIGVASVLFLKISIPIIETISYYYGYYGFSSLEQYFWTTHETDSFLYHIHQGER